jgi:hypothetical protein
MYKYVTCIWDHGRDQLNEEINLYSLVSGWEDAPRILFPKKKQGVE